MKAGGKRTVLQKQAEMSSSSFAAIIDSVNTTLYLKSFLPFYFAKHAERVKATGKQTKGRKKANYAWLA